MGVKMSSQDKEKSQYLEALETLVRNIVKRTTEPWFWNDLFYNLFSTGRQDKKHLQVLENFIYSVIRSRKKVLLQKNEQLLKTEEKSTLQAPEEASSLGKRKRLAFLDLLLEQTINEPSRWTDADVEEEMEFFFAAAHDTTTETLVWTLFCLGNEKRIQAALHAEVDHIWAKYAIDDAQCQLTSEHLNRMPYLEACINESMRLFTPVPTIGRYIKADIEHEGFVIPKGTTVSIMIEKMHQDPAFFPKPERYIPERFLDKNAPFKKNPFAFIPFSAGFRK